LALSKTPGVFTKIGFAMNLHLLNKKLNSLRVLLLIPPRKRSSVFLRTQYYPPIGLAYLAAYARQQAKQDNHSLDFKIVDSLAEKIEFKDLPGIITSYQPDVIGINFYTENRFEALKTAEIIKKSNRDILIVGGGPHATLATDDTLRNFGAFDLLVRGEGELKFYNILKACLGYGTISTVGGVSYRDADKLIHNPDLPHIKDLDSIPYPAHDLLKMDRYFGSLDWTETTEKMAMLVTSRGCPYKCNFCSSAKVWGNRYRTRTPENIVGEIKQIKNFYQISAIIFFDDTLTINKKRTLTLCEEITKNQLDIRWLTHSRVDAMNEEMMVKMKEAGCVGIMFGVESGSQRIIDEVIKKKITVAQAKEVSHLSKKLNMTNNFSYIISHPQETEEDVEKTMDMVKLHLQDNQTTVLNIMRLYPGTYLEDYAVNQKLVPADFSWSKNINYDSGIVSKTLKGNVPFFRDKLSWDYIYAVNSRYLRMVKYPIWRHAWDAFKNIRSARDFLELLKIGIIQLKTYLNPG
jgi:radical SAM superfamily enzyme YgiQ (UPF0313 family)